MSYPSRPSTPHLQPGQVLADTYRIEGFVGRGGMGEVYEASHARLAGRYAVKLLLQDLGSVDDALHRFKQEAEVTSRLRHPNIVHVIDFDRMHDGTPYLVMEFLEGHDLAEELRVVPRLSPVRAADLVEQVAAGLAAAHDEGIVHRDLKPANIFLSPLRGSQREIAKIVDFGISKIRAVSTGVTRTQAVIGTPEYMSPEQARGLTRDVDARTDQFSLGCIAYEMLAGHPPFFGDSVPSIMYQVVHEPAPSLVDVGVHQELDQVVRRAMSKNPADRYPSAAEFAVAFGTATRGSGGTAVGMPVASLPGGGSRPSRPAHSTTFRGTNGEIAGTIRARSSRSRLRAVLGVGAGLTTVLALVALLASRDDRSKTSEPKTPITEPAPATATAAPAPALAPEIEVEVVGAPPELTVAVDGRPATLPLRLPRSETQHRLLFSAPGHHSTELWVRATTNVVIPLSLEEVPPSVKPQPARAKRENKPARPLDHAVTDL